MWMNEWVRSKHTKKDLHQTAFSTWKTQFSISQLKFAPSPRLHLQSDHIIHTQKNQVKTLHIDLSWDHLNSSLQAKTQIWSHKHKCYVGLKKKLTPHLRLSYFNHHSEYIQYSWSSTYLGGDFNLAVWRIVRTSPNFKFSPNLKIRASANNKHDVIYVHTRARGLALDQIFRDSSSSVLEC